MSTQSKKRASSFLWGLLVLITLSTRGFAESRPSFKNYKGRLQMSSEIPKLFKVETTANFKGSSELEKLIKSNQEVLEQLQGEFENSASFERGQIEDPELLNEITEYLQLALLQVRFAASKAEWGRVQKNMAAWFQFAADFPYEESSLIGLRFTGVVRAMLLDELEELQKKYAADISKTSELRKWFQRVRAPWPVDRVIVSEAKRVLKGPYHDLANHLARVYQKNPYQSAEQALKKMKGGGSEGAKLLAQFWRDSDIDAMKTEVNRISKLKVKFALKEFEFQQKKAAAKIEDLVKAGLLDSVPTDYFTGRPLDLTSL